MTHILLKITRSKTLLKGAGPVEEYRCPFIQYDSQLLSKFYLLGSPITITRRNYFNRVRDAGKYHPKCFVLVHTAHYYYNRVISRTDT